MRNSLDEREEALRSWIAGTQRIRLDTSPAQIEKVNQAIAGLVAEQTAEPIPAPAKPTPKPPTRATSRHDEITAVRDRGCSDCSKKGLFRFASY